MKRVATALVLAALGCRPSQATIERAASACARYTAGSNESWQCLDRYGLTPRNCDDDCSMRVHVASLDLAIKLKRQADYLDCMKRLGPASCDQQYHPEPDWPGYDISRPRVWVQP